MAQIDKAQPLLPSVLDRLLDDNPSVDQEPEYSRAQVVRELHESIKRDLQSLLNTRRLCLNADPNLAELQNSLITYGIPDFSTESVGSNVSREKFQRTLEESIQRNESRFKSVKVKLMKNSDSHDLTLRFRIDALVYADPAPEPLAFDSQLEPVTYNFQIKGEHAT